jgi:hypothetical protein
MLPAVCSCRAQREEITSLRRALAETQDVMYKGKAAYNDVVQTKDMQIAQVRAGLCSSNNSLRADLVSTSLLLCMRTGF